MLAELRQQLEAQIRDGQLPEALKALLDKLPEGSETYKIVSALIARLNAANKARFRNTISSEEYQRRVDQVSADAFDLLGGLQEADFSPSSAKTTVGKAGKQGSVLYRVPDVMRVQKPTRCTIRVAVDEDAILENLVLDEHVEVKPKVEISDVMSAELLDPEGGTFQISPLNARTQLVKETGYTEWNFNVIPLIEGVHQLLVKVSILEVVPGFSEPIPREVSVMETVTIVTESAVPSEAPSKDFKATGETFGFQQSSNAQPSSEIHAAKAAEPAKSPSVEPPKSMEPDAPTSSRMSQPLRALAVLLAFLVIVPAATWAFVPAPTLDWWITSVQDTPESYAEYIQEYEKKGSPHLEKAFFYKAEATGQLADLRAYQEKFQQGGRFEGRILGKIAVLESKSLESIKTDPDTLKIRRFASEFPETERLTEVKQAVEARAEHRQELLKAVENAYVSTVKTKPSETKIVAYLRDFPKQERLSEVEAAARTKPEVFQKVQPILEDAYLKKMEQNSKDVSPEQFLEKFPEPVRREKFEKVLEQKPGLKKKVEKQFEAKKKLRTANGH